MCALSDGISLNDVIHQGPKLQRELFSVLLRFCKNPVALVCDIAEMYFRISLAPEDRPFHRFLWRSLDQTRTPDVYEFNRVVFGVNSSPFQAQFVTQEHAQKHKEEFPMAAETILKSTYMDNSMDSTSDDQKGIELYKQLSELWGRAGMHERKWLSNSRKVLEDIPVDDRASETESEIQSSSNPNQWRYVPTNEIPADFVTRGLTVPELAEKNSWWEGPSYLKEKPSEWPINKLTTVRASDTEVRKSNKCQLDPSDGRDRMMVTIEGDGESRLEPKRFSSWLRLTRIQARIYRFLKNCLLPNGRRTRGELTVEEIQDAEIRIIKAAQRLFKEECSALSSGKPLPMSSKLLTLKPRLDEDGVVRSDGRLENAEYLPYDVKYPIILPRKEWVTKLIVRWYHQQGNHPSGTHQTLAMLSSRFWLMQRREEIRECKGECYECRRRKAKAAQQVMAPLPKIRLKMPPRAFSRTAVDFGGPFMMIQGRGKRRAKRYLCLFTCLTSRALHLEIAYGLDTDSFLNAFCRMASRRGLPEEMISDNGNNFVGADLELRELIEKLDKDKIASSTANRGISGKFAPESVDETDFNLRKRWRRIQELIHHFWNRWMREWLPKLNARKKWFKHGKDLKVGDIVLVISPDTPRGQWPLGRIAETIPGKDGQMRVAKVRIGQKIFERPISKLCPLECKTDD
ncbi:hypothetical protein AWC38_SpisGene22069 [Stylophora pistillata]|uniref:DUF5641 domain-containing protein n=1 Tax=Stylophora pistillata TaxID=50429 RepID=A0A2B4RBS5_STYPI|nr:hypothetical protein AWC38_SpisGene22069 [Stylophora pistillata]